MLLLGEILSELGYNLSSLSDQCLPSTVQTQGSSRGGWSVLDTEIHYLVCLVLLFPIKCNYGVIELLLTFSKPCYKLWSVRTSQSVFIKLNCLRTMSI